jgi:hypothetical protein
MSMSEKGTKALANTAKLKAFLGCSVRPSGHGPRNTYDATAKKENNTTY